MCSRERETMFIPSRINTGCTQKNIGILSGSYGYVSSRSRLYPTSDKRATVDISNCTRKSCFLTLSRDSATVQNGEHCTQSFLCSAVLRSAIRWLQFSGRYGDNLDVILHLTTTFGGGNHFQTTGCLCKGKSTGRPRVSGEKVERVRASFAYSSKKICTTCQS
jgi:hypothetical protein